MTQNNQDKEKKVAQDSNPWRVAYERLCETIRDEAIMLDEDVDGLVDSAPAIALKRERAAAMWFTLAVADNLRPERKQS